MEGKNKLRYELFDEQEGQCFWCHCDCKIEWAEYGSPHAPDMFTVDHLVPKSRGGSDAKENVVGACSKCNQLRSSIEQAIVCRKNISGFGKRKDIEALMPYMSVEEVLVELKDRIEPSLKDWPLKKWEVAQLRSVSPTGEREGE